MIDLHRYFQNPFDDPEISLNGLLAFSTDHLQRMIANNSGGSYSARIAATTAALQAVQSSTTDDLTKLGVRKARKLAKQTFRKALPEKIAKLQGAVIAKFGAKGAEVAECFPDGRTIFTKSPDDKLESQLRTLIAGVTAHQAQLGAPVVAEAEALRVDWLTVYSASETSTGGKAATEQQRRAARLGLQLELFLNLLALAAQFPRQPERLDLFLQPSLLTGAA